MKLEKFKSELDSMKKSFESISNKNEIKSGEWEFIAYIKDHSFCYKNAIDFLLEDLSNQGLSELYESLKSIGEEMEELTEKARKFIINYKF